MLLSVATAAAWWSTSATLPARISTGTWGGQLSFSPGCSKAAHWSSHDRSQLQPIASPDSKGNLSLDFGDALQGASSSWYDVFRVTSRASAPLNVAFSASGAIGPFVRSVSFAGDTTGGLLNPKQTRSAAVTLVIPRTAISGTYSGTLSVAFIGGAERYVIPVTVTVLAKHPSPSPSPSRSPSPSCSPSPSRSPSPSCSPSPSRSPSPSCSPSASCSPTPSPSLSPCFTLSAGLSTVLAGWSTQTPLPQVAQWQPDGTMTLVFGNVPRAQKLVFDDVVRMTSTAASTTNVTLTLSGTAAKNVQLLGFWDGKRHPLDTGLTLKMGQTAQVGFQFDLSKDAPLGPQSGTLTIAAKPSKGQLQQCALPFTLDVSPAGPAPITSSSPSPSGTPTRSPDPSVSPDTVPTPPASADASASLTASASASLFTSPGSFLGGLLRALGALV